MFGFGWGCWWWLLWHNTAQLHDTKPYNKWQQPNDNDTKRKGMRKKKRRQDPLPRYFHFPSQQALTYLHLSLEQLIKRQMCGEQYEKYIEIVKPWQRRTISNGKIKKRNIHLKYFHYYDYTKMKMVMTIFIIPFLVSSSHPWQFLRFP